MWPKCLKRRLIWLKLSDDDPTGDAENVAELQSAHTIVRIKQIWRQGRKLGCRTWKTQTLHVNKGVIEIGPSNYERNKDHFPIKQTLDDIKIMFNDKKKMFKVDIGDDRYKVKVLNRVAFESLVVTLRHYKRLNKIQQGKKKVNEKIDDMIKELGSQKHMLERIKRDTEDTKIKLKEASRFLQIIERELRSSCDECKNMKTITCTSQSYTSSFTMDEEDKSFEKSPNGVSAKENPKLRSKLPTKPKPIKAISKMGVLTDIMQHGKPVIPMDQYEPISTLQFLCEQLEHWNLINKAIQESDPAIRMSIVTSFIISGYSGKEMRKRKPFQGVCGETYEFDCRATDGWCYHAEQINEDPKTAAADAYGKGWNWSASLSTKNDYNTIAKGHLKIKTIGNIQLELYDWEEIYQWNIADIDCSDLFGVNRSSKPEGVVEVKCNNGIQCQLDFTNYNIHSKIWNKDKELLIFDAHLSGKVELQLTEGKRTIFEGPSNCDKSEYGFTKYTIGLNDDVDVKFLPQTDSRFRPDIRHLEKGDIKMASHWKQRIDQSKGQSSYIARWFIKTRDNRWRTNHKYWESKKTGFQNDHLPKLW